MAERFRACMLEGRRKRSHPGFCSMCLPKSVGRKEDCWGGRGYPLTASPWLAI